jgi:hypothetical protein
MISSARQNIPPKIEGEPDRAYEFFLIHVLSGQARSLPNTAAICGKSASQLEKLSSRWGWQERAKSYDDQFLRDVATRTREKHLLRFQNSFEKNIILNERIMTVSGTVLEALEGSIKAIDSPSFDSRIKKILSAAKAVELLSRTVQSNMTIHANLTGLDLLAKQLLDQEKNPKQPSDRYHVPKDKIRQDREYLKNLDKLVEQ